MGPGTMIRKTAKVKNITGNVKHYVGRKVSNRISPMEGVLLPDADTLLITERNGSFFLDRFTKHGDAITDTWHRSLELAFHQAKFEYEVEEDDWIDIPDDIEDIYKYIFPNKSL
jgi:hypothetical protein